MVRVHGAEGGWSALRIGDDDGAFATYPYACCGAMDVILFLAWPYGPVVAERPYAAHAHACQHPEVPHMHVCYHCCTAAAHFRDLVYSYEGYLGACTSMPSIQCDGTAPPDRSRSASPVIGLGAQLVQCLELCVFHPTI